MSHSESQFSLLRQQRFLPLFVTQFLGAFNDNVFKNALIILIAFQASNQAGLDSNTLINLSAGLFILPFFLFSASAGQCADKFEKARLIRFTKLLEIIIMACAFIGFYTQNIALLMALLFLMGTQSTLFGPLKYGILPQHLHTTELIGGNGLIETGTFLAILLGTMTGGILIGMHSWGPQVVSFCVIVIALLGYLASRAIPVAAPVAPDLKLNWNPFTETARNIGFARQNRTVFLSILGNSWFWFLGSIYLTQLPNYTKLTLGGNEQVVTLLLTLFSLGIGIGSLLCERLSNRMVEIGLVPFGSIGLTVFGIDLYFAAPAPLGLENIGISAFLAHPGSWRVALDIVLLGIFGGVYIVPLYALIQSRSKTSHRSRVIAANNIINALMMVISALMAILLLNAGFSIPQLFLLAALLNAIVAVYIYTLVPEFLLRFLVWILVHIMYRVRKTGTEHIPATGPVVLVCNHVSFIDALIIAGCVRRPTRFVMDHHIFALPVLRFLFKTAGAIPIASAKEDPVLLEQAFMRISEYLDNNEIVCIFPEGKITSDGALNPFRGGIERIISTNPVPVVPIALRGLWGSWFSRSHGKAMSRLPRPHWRRLELIAGIPVPAHKVSATELQHRVAELRGDQQ